MRTQLIIQREDSGPNSPAIHDAKRIRRRDDAVACELLNWQRAQLPLEDGEVLVHLLRENVVDRALPLSDEVIGSGWRVDEDELIVEEHYGCATGVKASCYCLCRLLVPVAL